MQIAPDFVESLDGLDVNGLDQSDNTAYGVRDEGLTLAFCNRAWARFATENDGPDDLVDLCTDHVSVLSVVDPVLRPFYEALYTRVSETREPESHDYACHSPEVERWYRMRVTPLRRGLLVVHHLIVHEPHRPTRAALPPHRYVDAETGFATQCCHCRSTRRADAADTWDWVPAFLDRNRHDVSHGLCPICFAHYFPEAAVRRAALSEAGAI